VEGVVPFWWWDHFYYSCLHSVLVDSGDEFLKVCKLIHCLKKNVSRCGESSGEYGFEDRDVSVVVIVVGKDWVFGFQLDDFLLNNNLHYRPRQFQHSLSILHRPGWRVYFHFRFLCRLQLVDGGVYRLSICVERVI